MSHVRPSKPIGMRGITLIGDHPAGRLVRASSGGQPVLPRIDEEITFRKLEILLAFMESGSLARTAERLSVSAVSVHRCVGPTFTPSSSSARTTTCCASCVTGVSTRRAWASRGCSRGGVAGPVRGRSLLRRTGRLETLRGARHRSRRLRRESFVSLSEGFVTYGGFMEALRIAGFKPKVVMTTGDIFSLTNLVSGGMGFTLLPVAGEGCRHTGHLPLVSTYAARRQTCKQRTAKAALVDRLCGDP